VTEIWGVSSRLGARLNRLGIATSLELKRLDPHIARKQFSIVMERIVRELRGEVCLELEQEPPPKQQIHVSRSFGELVSDLESLEEAVSTYAARLGEKLRRQNSVASGLYVYIRTNPFRPDDPQYENGIAMPLTPATAHSGKLIAAAKAGLHKIYRQGFRFKKAGVMALDLADAGAAKAQGNLFFSQAGQEKDARLMAMLDQTNRRYGDGALHYASQGMPGQRGWSMRREMLSPLYTTRWEDAPLTR
jgi:DNA polymerase V